MKTNASYNYNRLPMEGAYNVRELGGYAAANGAVTRYHEFLRSERLDSISKKDWDFLKCYGLGAIIDLRGEPEAEKFPNAFADDDSVAYINLPFITDNVLDMREVREKGFDPGQFYINLTEYRRMVGKLMRFIIRQRKKCVLFHCTAGKDRTGVLAMILLGICGVSREDIMANYEVTYSYLDGNVDVDYPVGLEKLQYSKREWIAGAYDHILEKYGSFYRYFIACGLTPTEIRLVRRKLTGRRRRLCVL